MQYSLQPNALLLSQERTEAILRSHLEKQGCHVELCTELRSFEQHTDHVIASLVRKDGNEEYSETVVCHWLAGTDGARGNIPFITSYGERLIFNVPAGVVRKHLGIPFLGETRENEHIVVAEIEVQGIDSIVSFST